VHGWVVLSYFSLSGNVNALTLRLPEATPTMKYNIPTSTPRPYVSSRSGSGGSTSSSGASSCYSVPIPPPPPDLDCKDISYCRFAVYGCDPHGFDGDGDGIGCEVCR